MYWACCLSVTFPFHLAKSPVGRLGFVDASHPNSVTQISLPFAFSLRQTMRSSMPFSQEAIAGSSGNDRRH